MVWSLSTGPSMDPTRLEFGFKISSKKFPSSSINFWINSFGSFLFLNRLQQQQNQKHNSIHPVNDHCRQHFANEPSKMLNYSVSLNQNSVTESQSPAESHVLYSKNAFLLNIWGTNVPVYGSYMSFYIMHLLLTELKLFIFWKLFEKTHQILIITTSNCLKHIWKYFIPSIQKFILFF